MTANRAPAEKDSRANLERSDFPVARAGGSRADRRTGETIDRLQERGFLIVRDIEHGDGSIDHLVSGPSGVFLIQARYLRCRKKDLIQARERAEELRAELDTWVTPMICLTGPFARRPRRREKVWVVRRRQITAWIAGRRNPVLEGGRRPRQSEPL
jgi:hypothetical protein